MNPEEWFERMRDEDRWTNHVPPVAAPRRRVFTAIAIAAVIVLFVVVTLAIVPAFRSMRIPVPAATTAAPVVFLQANGVASGGRTADQLGNSPVALWGPNRTTISIVTYSLAGCPATPTGLNVEGSETIRLSMEPVPEDVACGSGSAASTITFAVPAGIDTAAAVIVEVPVFGQHPTTLRLRVGGKDAIRPCTSGDFALSLGDEALDLPGGVDIRALVLTKSGADSCVLNGAPYLTMVDVNGALIGAPAASAVIGGTGGPLIVGPGDRSYVRLTILRAKNYLAGACDPVSASAVKVVVTGSLKLDDSLQTAVPEMVCTTADAHQLAASNYVSSSAAAVP